MKISLLGASFDTNNMGVSALTAGAIVCILHRYPDAEISLLDYGNEGRVIQFPYGQKTVPIRLVNIRFSKKFWLRNNVARLIAEALVSRLIPFTGLRRAFIRRNPWLEHLEQTDLVVAISGGDSFSDIYGLPRFIYVSLPQILAVLMGKTLILLPQTLGPFDGTVARAGARYILRRARAVYSRDRAGLGLAAGLLNLNGDSDKLRFCYDVGFAVEPRAPARLECAGLPLWQRLDVPLAGLNISGLLYSRDHQWGDAFGLRVDYKSLVHALVEFLIRDKKANVVLIPHVFGTGGETDPPACEAVYEALKDKYPGKIGIVRGRYDESEIKHVIGTCDFFIGSRMHACIAATSQCVPAVSIAYSDKFIGVMETVGMKALVADPRRQDQAAVLRLIGEAFDKRDELREELQRIIPGVKQTVLGLFGEIQETIQDSAEEPSPPRLPVHAPEAERNT
ncbi:MAG TPA: polysaccharide pyruvyl transferase family protein [Terriglobia bacterium]|nr:polysaccharide pyruvyl transferase family protein [Terriglobia bacterium]